MMHDGLHMDIFIRELKSMLTTVITKRTVLAKEQETLDTTKAAEMFIMVTEGLDDFSSYNNFEYSVYQKVGVPEPDIYKYRQDKNKIPFGLRSALIKFQRQYILSTYVEKNNYYRMLNGQPDYEDTDFIYAPENTLGVSTTIPIHQLTQSAIERLRAGGILDQLKAKYPTKKYLNYLGIYSIGIYKARTALNYEMLYCGSTNPVNIGLNFQHFYSNAREYYMNAIYNSNTAHGYEYYDNFIGLCIMVMAIQRLFASIFEQGITRDFYDVQLVRYLFDSYSIPFIEDMTLDQMKLLAKNLNIFLKYKSSNKVIFDLCSIFGFSNVNVYKYLLVRDHVKSSSTGKPIFPTTTISNGDGTYSTVPDYELMYDIYFEKVNIKTKDMSAALVDKSNTVDYKSMTTGDIYWVDDEELRDRLYTAGMNYIESKYLSMDILFRITEMMYEICHFFRMVIDNNSEFRKIYVSIPKVSGLPQDLYSVIIFLCAMFCKRYGFTGEVPMKPASIAYVYGFNFHTDLAKLANDILESKYIDDDVVKYLLNFQVTSNKDVDRIYGNIKALKDFCTEQMAATKDIEVYRAYKALYKSALVVEDKEEMYTKEDGTVAETYFDLLKSISPELYAFVEKFDTTDAKNTEEIMIHVLYRLEDLSERLKYLHTAVDSNALIRVLVRLIRFFKSYTVDLSHCGILYLFDDRFLNMLKILDGIHSIDIKMWQDDGFLKMYYDAIAKVDIDLNDDEKISFLEEWYAYVLARVMDKLYLKEDLFATVYHPVETQLLGEYADTLDLDLRFTDGEHIKLADKIVEIIIRMLIDERIDLREELLTLVNKDVYSRVLGEYADNMTILMKMPIAGKILLFDQLVDHIVTFLLNEYLHFKEELPEEIFADVSTQELLGQYNDMLSGSIFKNVEDEAKLIVALKDFEVHLHREEVLRLSEKLTPQILARIQTNNVLIYSDDITASIWKSRDVELKFVGKLSEMLVEKALESKMHPYDRITYLHVKRFVQSLLLSEDYLGASSHINKFDRQKFTDELADLTYRFILEGRMHMTDRVHSSSMKYHLTDDPLTILSDLQHETAMKLEEKISMRDELKVVSVG